MRNLPLTFDHSTYSQKLGEDFAKFCGLLRIYELRYALDQGFFPKIGVILKNSFNRFFCSSSHHMTLWIRSYCYLSFLSIIEVISYDLCTTSTGKAKILTSTLNKFKDLFRNEIGLLDTNTQNNFVRLKVATSGTSSNSA